MLPITHPAGAPPAPRAFSVFEHRTTDGFGWTDADLRRLERLNRAAGAELLRAVVTPDGRRELRAFQHVGVVRLGGRTIHVLPKLCAAGDGEDAATPAAHRDALRALLRWLGYAGRLPFREAERAALSVRHPDWFEVMTRLFARHLSDEWARGPLRTYEARDDDRAPALRGRWRIAEQARRPVEKQMFLVTADEFTGDNAPNRVLRYVVERLWRLTRDAENRRRLTALREAMEADGVTLPPAVSADEARAAESAAASRLHRRHAPLLALARLFLTGGGLELLPGGPSAGSRAEDTFSFVLDMNALFEEFVFGFLWRHRDTILPPALAGCDLWAQGVGRETAHLGRRSDTGTRVFRLKPDIALRDPVTGAVPLILDTKYKRRDLAATAGAASEGVGQDDFYQMFAYAHRFDCPRVLLLYPAGSADDARRPPLRFTLEGSGDRLILAASVEVRRDLGRPDERAALITDLRRIIEHAVVGPHQEKT
jgi:5-methylcytosine-specific restriction enzyme subunit McrC